MHLPMFFGISFLPVHCTKFFTSHWLLFHVTMIVEKMESDERRMNPTAMTINNPLKEYWANQRSNQRPPLLKSCTLPT